MANKKYDAYTTSYSGTDMIVSLVFPETIPIVMGTATTITYSLFRQIAQVRTLGRITSRGFARGGRGYSGTIIFTVIREAFVEEVRRRVASLTRYKKLTPDELPPADIILTFGNEFGQSASLVLYGVRFVDESKTMSVEDIFTENVLSFVCEEIQHMKNDEKGFNYEGGQTFRDVNEDLGTFKVSELLANIEDEARRKRLQEIAEAEKKRWEEPVGTDPGVVPNFDPVPNSGGGGGGGSGGSGEANITYDISVKVTEANANKVVSGATIKVQLGSQVTKTTGTDGFASFKNIDKSYKGKTLKFTISKSGYISTTKSVTVGTSNATGVTVNVYLQKQTSGGEKRPSDTVALSRKIGKYADNLSFSKKPNGKWLFNKSDSKDQLQIQLKNSDGEPLAGVGVYWYYQYFNYDDLGFNLFDVNLYKKESGQIGNFKSTTDKDGVAKFPGNSAFSLGDFHNDGVIEIIARPNASTKNNSQISPDYWQSWFFH